MDVRFRPTQRISRSRMLVRGVVAPLLWAGAVWLAVVELDHGPFLRDIVLVTLVAFVLACVFLLSGVWLRRHEERRDSW
ncbi:hypothetical protein [Streptomyces sp. NPDC002644]